MAPAIPVSTTDVLQYTAVLYLLYQVVTRLIARRTGIQPTTLDGPPSESFLWGMRKTIINAPDNGALFEGWAETYGPVFSVPSNFGRRDVVLFDPRAIAHFYAHDPTVYVQTGLAKRGIANLVGRGILVAEGEDHKRQRKALSPAFSNAAIRRITPIFYDSAYKVKAAWDAAIEESPTNEAVIDVQGWMNHVSLDSIGIAGFSHDFESLHGRPSTVATLFGSFATLGKPSVLGAFAFLLAPVLPLLMNLPTRRHLLVNKLNENMEEIAAVLLQRSRREKEGGEVEKSIIGMLLKAESEGVELHMSHEEIMAQMKVLLLAGYETTSISLTWALIELAQHPAAQDRLRAELAEFAGTDPSWNQLTGSLPFLDAVVHEVLRLHPPVEQTSRVAVQDDVLPLRTPLPGGADRIAVKAGTVLIVPIRALNRATAVWGADAKEFLPERWLENEGTETSGAGWAREMSGHRHLLTFVDGPRTCLGKGFALAEFKAALSVLIRSFVFDQRDGLDTKLEMRRGILPRPAVAGEEGTCLPMRVRRVE